MRNETYKHLEDPVRIGPFTIGQWVMLVGTTFLAVMFGMYVSPLPPKPTVTLSMFIGLLPPAVAYAADGADMRVRETVVSMVRWARGDKHFLPGGGVPVEGYVIAEKVPVVCVPVRAVEDVALARRQLEGAWEA